ncbi:glycerophosphodiester phosphodiesterase [uncultured Friedmanniella sp.]|uniref:glycerophosphodiester phosphodiesterase n=1 Tax=uncultured Friedmanniella sp. TaxID=335381 RepID=UPI0035CAE766
MATMLLARSPRVSPLRPNGLRSTRLPPVLIAHRGASGYRPEHTLAAYALAIAQGADQIEPDVVATADGELVARHENEISATTDVAAHPEFTGRYTTKMIDGVTRTGWFTEDFTLAELRTLRAVERLPLARPGNTEHDGRHQIPTLAEVAALAAASRTVDGRRIGICPETKHPSYFAGLGLPLEARLLDELAAAGFVDRHDPAMIQSFETTNLRWLARQTSIPLLQLIESTGAPWDLASTGDPRRYADLVSPAGLRQISGYAEVLGVDKNLVIPRDATGRLLAPTPLAAQAHAVGLQLCGWTFRRENQFLPLQFRSSDDPYAVGDLEGELRRYLDAGLDSFFTDNPDIGVRARLLPERTPAPLGLAG